MVDRIVNPPHMKAPPKLINDPELRGYFNAVDYFLYQIWLRTGGGADFIDESRGAIVVSTSQSSNYTQVNTNERVFVDASGGAVTITLLDADEGVYCDVVKVDATTNKVYAASADNVNGAPQQELRKQFESIECASDDSQWVVI